jgi:hypothetical protein
MIGFGSMKQQSSSPMRLRQAELMILIQGSKGGEIHQKGNLVHILLKGVTTTRNHHKEDSMVATRV